MDAFSSSPSSGSPSQQFSPDDFKDQLKNQLAQAYAEEFLEVFTFSFLV
jgi:import inner membrane translocase subunit TIM13